ncbi:MAG: hypothetical protein K0R81_2833 [Microbacterium sp.]|jgi:hypothetical protein|nr:hypothetical protein [Microbacterium sp.]
MRTVTRSEAEGLWSLSLLYISVVLALSLSGVFSLGVASFAWASDASPLGLRPTLCIIAVGGAALLVGVCLRVRGVRARLRPGAVSIAASMATFLAVGWTVVVVVGYRENADDVWRQLPLALGICAPALIVAISALTISRFVQRDDARRAAAARGAVPAP